MDQVLLGAILLLSVACTYWLLTGSLRTVCRATGAGVVVFSAAYLIGFLVAPRDPTATMLAVVAGGTVFVLVCPSSERRLRRQREEAAWQLREQLTEWEKKRRRGPDEWRRYRELD